jgi:NDP-sugar pyrophosphorylase family protein
MDVKAIVVVGPLAEGSEVHSQGIVGTPYALSDVLGKPVVLRVIDRLRNCGVDAVTVVTDVEAERWPRNAAKSAKWIGATGEQLWEAVEQAFLAFQKEDADVVLLIRLGAFTELDYTDLLAFHLRHQAPITAAIDGAGMPLDVCVLSASHADDAAFLIRNRLRKFRNGCDYYSFAGYINRLSSPNHLRQLAIEGLMQRIQLQPEGEQVKPGVWLGRGARVHKRARVLSPAFIGVGARVRAAAVITRCSALEHYAAVDCGTVVENTTVLPGTHIGAGLDITHSIVGRSRLFNLKRGVEVEFCDPRLIGESSSRAPLRALGSLVSLAGFPLLLLRGLFASSHREHPASLPESAVASSSVKKNPAPIKAAAPSVDAGEFPSQLVIARRYGDE